MWFADGVSHSFIDCVCVFQMKEKSERMGVWRGWWALMEGNPKHNTLRRAWHHIHLLASARVSYLESFVLCFRSQSLRTCIYCFSMANGTFFRGWSSIILPGHIIWKSTKLKYITHAHWPPWLNLTTMDQLARGIGTISSPKQINSYERPWCSVARRSRRFAAAPRQLPFFYLGLSLSWCKLLFLFVIRKMNAIHSSIPSISVATLC